MGSNPNPLQILLLKYIYVDIYIFKGEERRGEEKEKKKKIVRRKKGKRKSAKNFAECSPRTVAEFRAQNRADADAKCAQSHSSASTVRSFLSRRIPRTESRRRGREMRTESQFAVFLVVGDDCCWPWSFVSQQPHQKCGSSML